jgi:hypothetical protein
MGGKTSKSTQAITVPPEVLARYNAVNTRADAVTNRPYQYYTGQFVAPLTGTQQAGIANTNAAAGMAQPYFGAATGQLMGAQQAASPYYQGATDQLNQGIYAGNQYANQSAGTLSGAQDVGNQLAGQSYGAINQAQGVGNQYANQSSGTLSNAQNVGNQLAAQSYGTMGDAQGVGNQLAAQSYGALGSAQDVGSQLAGQSLNTINSAQQQAAGIQEGALGGLGAAYSGAQPYNQAAGGLYQQGLEQGRDLTGQSSFGTQQALAGAQPYQGIATQYMGAGAQAVNPNELGADQINKYLSPYLNTVLQGTAGLLNQQNQQQQAGQMGNAIRSGAFGGDRSGIAAANLNQQQNLANSKIYSDILNQGFGQALGTAQQQQQLGLGAAQANRAAQQQASQQALAIGQQGFGQGLSAAQQQAALGQQLFGMGSTTGQNAAALGQQIYNQGTGTAQQQAALAQQMFGQGATTAAQQAALGQQQFGQGATAAQQLASLGQQQFGQGLSIAQQQAALGQQQFGQGATAAQQQAALGQQQFGQGATTSQQLSNLGQQQFGQGATAAAQQAALGQQQFGQGTAASQQAAALGQGIYGMGSATSQQLANLGTGAQGAALSGAGAQLAAGQAEQATQQAENTAKYNEFLQAQSLPYQQLKLASDIALGTGTASGSTTTTAQPGGFFSDERLKENIKAVGKTFDGQTIHSYNYKGDPRTQIGLIAQEVQKHHPEAVGLAGGYKTVNYDKATEDAADRGHMASGGLASAGGSVMPQDAGQGFSNGGLAGFDPSVMQQMLAAQQAMYAPLSSGNMYAGGPNAGGGLVPQSSVSAGQLMTPAALSQQATGAEKAKAIVDLGNSVNKFGEGIGAWGDDDKKPKDDKYRLSKDLLKEIGAASDTEKAEGKAMGGGIPYGGQGLDIPTSGLGGASGNPMTAGALPGQQSGLDKLGKAANVADTGMKLAKFGKKIGLFADGGGVPYGGQGLDIPDEDTSSKSYQLPTAGSMEKPESGLDKVGKAAKIAGTVAKVAAMFSDKRVKENIKPIGKLFDGQIVHSFNYKGDPRTQIGLIAQEVEGHKPHAVGLAGKYKTVDYDKATSGAAKRGHFAEGGMPKVPVNSILASLRKEIDPRSNLSSLASEQDMELDRNLRPDVAPEPGLGALQSAPAVALPKDLKVSPSGLGKAEGIKNPTATISGPAPKGLDPEIVSFFRKKGLSEDQARGIAAGIMAESSGNHKAVNPTSGAMGLGQWLGPRKKAVISKYGDNPSKSDQLEHLWHELNGGDHGGPKVLEKEDAHSVLDSYIRDFMRPAKGHETTSDISRGRKALGYASGGLAGRDGYLSGGAPTGFNLSDKDLRDAEAASEMEKFEGEPIETATSMRSEAGLGAANSSALPTFTAADLARIGTRDAATPDTNEVKVTGVMPPAGASEAQAQPEKRAGLAQRVFGYDKSKPYDPKTNKKFLQRLGHGETDAVLTALQGLAAMGTAPTRSLGVALATGLGTGAQAYQAQREFGRQERETAALETNVEAAKMRANADIATARFNTNTLPGKIAGWRQIAAKGGPNAAFAAQTANTLQGIFDAAQKDLGGVPGKSADQLVPSDAPATGAAQTSPDTGVAVKTPPAAGKTPKTPAAPTSAGSLYEDLQFQSLAGNPTGAIEKQIAMAEKGFLWDGEKWVPDPNFTKTQIVLEGEPLRQRENITTDVGVGERIYDSAIQDNIQYQKALPIIQSIGSLPEGAVPTTAFINNLAKAVGAALGYDDAKMDAKFGEQPKINSILNAAAAEGINIDPSLGVAGVNVLIQNLKDKADIAYVRAEAAKIYQQQKGYSGGMEAFIDKSLRLSLPHLFK